MKRRFMWRVVTASGDEWIQSVRPQVARNKVVRVLVLRGA
jgi:hypothetical protein